MFDLKQSRKTELLHLYVASSVLQLHSLLGSSQVCTNADSLLKGSVVHFALCDKWFGMALNVVDPPRDRANGGGVDRARG